MEVKVVRMEMGEGVCEKGRGDLDGRMMDDSEHGGIGGQRGEGGTGWMGKEGWREERVVDWEDWDDGKTMCHSEISGG